MVLALVALLVTAVMAVGCGEETTATTAGMTGETAAPSTNTTASAAKTIKIGLIGDESGVMSFYWLPELDNIKAFRDIVNEKGGIIIQGQQYLIELVTADTKFTPEGSVSAANKLIFEDKVNFCIGGMNFENAAAGPLFEENKIIRIQWYTEGGPEEVNDNTPYTFVGVNSSPAQYTISLPTWKELFPETKTAALLWPDQKGAIEWVIPDVVVPLAEQNGYEVVNKDDPVLYATDMSDFTPIAQRLMRLNADLIITGGQPTQHAAILNLMREAGDDVGMIASPPPGPYLEALGENATKILCVEWPRRTDDAPPLYTEMLDRFEARNGPITAGTMIGMSCSTNLGCLLAMIEKADSLDPDKIVETWMSTDSIADTIQGEVLVCGDKTWGQHRALSGAYGYDLLMDGQLAETSWTATFAIP